MSAPLSIPPLLRSVCLLAVLLFCGCDDPKREAAMQLREKQASAREQQAGAREAEAAKAIASARQREEAAAAASQAVAEQAKRLKQQEADLASLKAQFEAEVAARRVELDKLEAGLKAAKVAFEMKAKRGPPPPITSQRVLVFNPATDEVLYERNADLKGAIASTTKLLTAILIIEAGNLDQEMVVEQSDTECAPVRMGLKAGERYTRRDLLTALMVKSSNDIAQALARDNAGSVKAFVAKMNAKAKELGCEECLFINPNGLPPVDDQPDPYCTARDLAKIARVADTLPDLRAMVKLKTYNFTKGDGKTALLENTNRVLRTYEYCDGMKTGYTQAAGHCLVSSGERNGRRRIVVVLNGSTTGVWRDSQALLEWALKM